MVGSSIGKIITSNCDNRTAFFPKAKVNTQLYFSGSNPTPTTKVFVAL